MHSTYILTKSLRDTVSRFFTPSHIGPHNYTWAPYEQTKMIFAKFFRFRENIRVPRNKGPTMTNQTPMVTF